MMQRILSLAVGFISIKFRSEMISAAWAWSNPR